jgi:hypothetical protein
MHCSSDTSRDSDSLDTVNLSNPSKRDSKRVFFLNSLELDAYSELPHLTELNDQDELFLSASSSRKKWRKSTSSLPEQLHPKIHASPGSVNLTPVSSPSVVDNTLIKQAELPNLKNFDIWKSARVKDMIGFDNFYLFLVY